MFTWFHWRRPSHWSVLHRDCAYIWWVQFSFPSLKLTCLLRLMSLSWTYRPQNACQLESSKSRMIADNFRIREVFLLHFASSAQTLVLIVAASSKACETSISLSLSFASALAIASVSLMSEDSSTIPWTRCFFVCFSCGKCFASSCAFLLPVSLSMSPFSASRLFSKSRGEVSTTSSLSLIEIERLLFSRGGCSARMRYGRNQLISC